MNAWIGKVCNIISIVNMMNNMLIMKTYTVSKIQNTSILIKMYIHETQKGKNTKKF